MTIILYLLIVFIFTIFILKVNIFYTTKLIILFWLIQLLLFMLIFGKYCYNISVGYSYIILALLCFLLGSVSISCNTHVNPRKTTVLPKRSKNVLNLLFLISLFGSIYPLFQKNVSLLSLLDFETLLEFNNETAIERYTSSSNKSSVINLIFIILIYLLPLVAGYIKGFNSRILSVIGVFIIFIPSVIVVLTSNTKAGFIASILLYIIGYLIASIRMNKTIVLTLSNAFKSIIVCVCLMSLLLFSMFLRIGKFEYEMLSMLIHKFSNYAIGHIGAFSVWLDNDFGLHRIDNINLGKNTFFGVVQLLGIGKRAQGVYQDSDIYGVLDSMSTNVYTCFRGFILDFGFIGSLLFLYLLGVLSKFLTIRVIRSNRSNLSQSILASIFFLMFFGTFVSPFSYVSFIAIFFIFYFVIRYISC